MAWRVSSVDHHRTTLWPASEGGRHSPIPWAWLLVLTLLAAALRAIALNQQLWFDEIATLIDSVNRSLTAILTTYTSQNQHTLYSVLTLGSIKLFGQQPWTLRLPAVVFGVASIPALYFFGRLITTRREALLASALMVFSYHHVWFSQNARGYTGLLFFTLAASFLFIRGLEESGWSLWLAYSLTLAFGLYLHLGMAFVVVAHGLVYLWLLRTRARELRRMPDNGKRPIAGFILAGLLSLLLYAPVLPQLFARTLGEANPSIDWEWSSPLWLIREALHGLSVATGLGLPGVAVGGLVVAAGFASYGRCNRYVLALMVLPSVVTAAALLAVGHNLWPRFFFFAIGFGFLLLVRGAMVCGEFGARHLGYQGPGRFQGGTVLVALMLGVSAWSLPTAYRYPKQDFIGAMQLIDAERKQGDAVVTVGLTTLPYQRYYRRDWQSVENDTDLESVRSRNLRTWLLYTFPVYLKHKHPDIWNSIQTEFTTVRVFRGTLRGGEVYVCRTKSRAGET